MQTSICKTNFPKPLSRRCIQTHTTLPGGGGCFSNQRANHNHQGLTHKCRAPPPGEADASGQGNHTWRTSPLLHPPAALKRLTHVLKGTDTFRQTQPASSSASLGPSLQPRILGSNRSCLLYVLQAGLLLPQEGKQVGEE